VLKLTITYGELAQMGGRVKRLRLQEKLACSLGRNDELPNIELLESLCQSKDIDGIAEIVEGFKGIHRAIANDCIKVLYTIPSIIKLTSRCPFLA